MIIQQLQSGLLSIEQDRAIFEEMNFDRRADTIDHIDFHLIDRIDGLLQAAPDAELMLLRQRAVTVKATLEAIDSSMFRSIKEQIRAGTLTGAAFREMTGKYLACDLTGSDPSAEPGYDNLDLFINGLLSGPLTPDATAAPEPEMVFYQKTPARIIFEMAQPGKISRDDIFVDIGSGLGQVVMLTHLLSGAGAAGIEYEPAYCRYAATCAAQLGLRDATFLHKRAQEADYSKYTVFFMYTPFKGEMLQDMLSKLQKEAGKRRIRIFTYGPCSPEVGLLDWLSCKNGPAGDPYKLYEFESTTTG